MYHAFVLGKSQREYYSFQESSCSLMSCKKGQNILLLGASSGGDFHVPRSKRSPASQRYDTMIKVKSFALAAALLCAAPAFQTA
jgi:hypothetical protein